MAFFNSFSNIAVLEISLRYKFWQGITRFDKSESLEVPSIYL